MRLYRCEVEWKKQQQQQQRNCSWCRAFDDLLFDWRSHTNATNIIRFTIRKKYWKTRFSVQWLFVLVADVIVIGISFSPTTCRDSICVSFWCQQSFVWLSASIEMFLSCQMAKTVIVNGYECISALLCCYFSLHVIHLFQTFSHWNRSDRHNYSSYENKTLLVCPVICIFYSQYKQQCECDNEQ